MQALKNGPIQVSIDDALQIKLLPGNFYLTHGGRPYVTTDYETMTKLPQCLVLTARLRAQGVPREMVEMVEWYWVAGLTYKVQPEVMLEAALEK